MVVVAQQFVLLDAHLIQTTVHVTVLQAVVLPAVVQAALWMQHLAKVIVNIKANASTVLTTKPANVIV